MNTSPRQFSKPERKRGGIRGAMARAEKMNETFWDRFWKRVDKNGPLPEHHPELGPCWLWTGPETGRGYCQVKYRGRSVMVHRISFEHHVGPIPDGMMLCHHCDRPRCVNWKHHFVGDNSSNQLDMWSKGRHSRMNFPRPTTTGSLNPRAKLDEEMVRQFRLMDWSEYGSRTRKARELGMSMHCFNLMLKGETWKHVR